MDVRAGPDVQHLVARPPEQVDAGRLGQAVGQVPLGPDVRRDRIGGGPQILQVGDAHRTHAVEERVQDVDRGARVRQRAVVRRHLRAEEARERGQLVVGRLVPRDHLPGQRHRVDHREARPGIVQPLARGLEEADVERRIVCHQHRVVRELQEARQHLFEVRRRGDHGVRDPGQPRDEGRDRLPGIDQGLELAQLLPAAHLHGPDLRDPALARTGPGGLEVDHDERDVPQGRPQLLERGLIPGGVHGPEH
ncbi:hypothetical protein GCM10027059_33790 [Myceligenerans halotolerans]